MQFGSVRRGASMCSRCSRSATFLEHAQQSMAHGIGSIAKVVFRLFG
jgi:hypothetical protein